MSSPFETDDVGDSRSPVVLVIDDDPGVIFFLRLVLEEEGYIVFEAINGHMGMALIPTISPDIVLLDVMLPDIDGVTACACIVEDRPGLPVIILTASDDPTLESRCAAAGARKFLTKPLLPEQIGRVLQSVLGVHPPAVPSSTH